MSCQARPRRSDRLCQRCSNAQLKKQKNNKKRCGKNLAVTNSLTPVLAFAQQPIFNRFGPVPCPLLIFLVCRAERVPEKECGAGFSLSFFQQLCNQTQIWPYLSGRSSTPFIMHVCLRALMYRWWGAVCKLAWPAVWFSEDIAEPPGPCGWAESTVHYSFTFTFIRILFRLPLIYGRPLTLCNNKNILSRFLFTWVGLGPLT